MSFSALKEWSTGWIRKNALRKEISTWSLRPPVEAEDVGIFSGVPRQVGEDKWSGWGRRPPALERIWFTLTARYPLFAVAHNSFEHPGGANIVVGDPSHGRHCSLVVQPELQRCLVAGLWSPRVDPPPLSSPLRAVPATSISRSISSLSHTSLVWSKSYWPHPAEFGARWSCSPRQRRRRSTPVLQSCLGEQAHLVNQDIIGGGVLILILSIKIIFDFDLQHIRLRQKLFFHTLIPWQFFDIFSLFKLYTENV